MTGLLNDRLICHTKPAIRFQPGVITMRTSETPFPSLHYRFKKYQFIDAHKGATPFVIIVLMSFYGAWDNRTAWLYLATHGIYGALWVTKSRIFADKQFDAACGLSFAALAWTGLSLY